MDDQILHSRLNAVFRRVFDDESLTISRELTARDVPDWDSLTHINLIVAVEREFKIRLTTAEVMRLENVGSLMDVIRRKSA
jgi:acyl carrier protein